MRNRPMQTALVRIATVASLLAFLVSTGECAELRVGAARVDITPDTPIRLSGYSARTSESTGVEDPLFVRALAIGEDREHAVVVVTADAILLPGALCDEIARTVFEQTRLPRERFAFCATHNHSAPCLENALGNLFATPLPADQLERIAQYTTKLKAGATQAILAAIDAMQPATLAFGRGSVGFAANRRTPGGPVDHDLPLLVARDPLGQPLATLVAYACHCTTHGLTQNRCAAEWAGHANLLLEASHPGLVALTAIGCGADATPKPTGDGAVAKQHGNAIAQEVERLLASSLPFISAEPTATLETIALPFATLPSRAEFEARLAKGGHVANHARHFLDMSVLPTELPYRIQTLRFGDELAMTFLAGEVVVDYAKRLKREIDPDRLFLAAYSNDCPCYIPSRRILEEGGYEAATAMTYYLQPTKLASAVEDLIVREVRRQVGTTFLTAESLAEFPLPKTPEQALAEFELADPKLSVALVASEPLIESPVWLEFGLFGELYVVEQRDFLSGLHGGGEPGGRVKRLIDIDHDGDYDEATIFLDGLEMPKLCIAHDGGLYVLTAKNVVFGKDVDGDGVAEERVEIETSLDTENRGARIESLVLAIDGWAGAPAGAILGEFGEIGARDTVVRSPRFYAAQFERQFESAGSKFWIHPLLIARRRHVLFASRVALARNDFGDWFGCNGDDLLVHFPLRERDLVRSPYVAPPELAPLVPLEDGAARQVLSPRERRPPTREFVSSDRITTARGLEIYRDSWLGAEYDNNAFVCDPAHGVVIRRILEPRRLSYRSRRAPNEGSREFLSSRDAWFRPMQAKTGPDGALYVVDFARFASELPQRSSPEQVARLDLRAGESLGRIWRIERTRVERRPVPVLTQLDPLEFVRALDSPNGTVRDLVHRALIAAGHDAIESGWGEGLMFELLPLAKRSENPAAAAHAIDCLVDLDHDAPELSVWKFVGDLVGVLNRRNDSRIRSRIIRLLEDSWDSDSESQPGFEAVLKFSRQAIAWGVGPPGTGASGFSVAAIEAQRMTWTLVELLRRVSGQRRASAISEFLKVMNPRDAYSRAAFAAVATRELFVPSVAYDQDVADPGYQAMLRDLCVLAERRQNLQAIDELSNRVATAIERAPSSEVVIATAARLMSASAALNVNRGQTLLESQTSSTPFDERSKAGRARDMIYSRLRSVVKDDRASEASRAAAVEILGEEPFSSARDHALLAEWLAPPSHPALQTAALGRLAELDTNDSRRILLEALADAAADLRHRILERVTERTSSASSLLNAISAKRVPAQFLDAVLRDRLLHHRDSSISAIAVAVLGKPAFPADELKAAQTANSLTGDRTRGEVVFDRSCASCHSYRGRGHDVGGELAFVGDRSLGRLLPAILDPNAKFDPAYEAYEIVTGDQRTRRGRIVGSTSISVLLELPGGTTETILRADIQSQRATGRSLMPEGFGIDLTPQDLADLGACLNSK